MMLGVVVVVGAVVVDVVVVVVVGAAVVVVVPNIKPPMPKKMGQCYCIEVNFLI